METLFRRGFSRDDEMKKRVARFKGSSRLGRRPSGQQHTGLRAYVVQCDRFSAPKGRRRLRHLTCRRRRLPRCCDPDLKGGFNLGYCRQKPGHGPMMHNHDTNGHVHTRDRKMAVQLGERGRASRVSRPRSARRHSPFRPGLIRRFENVTPGDKSQEHIFDVRDRRRRSARAEFTDDSMKELEHAGVWPPKAGSAQASSKR